jgi:hypothetical protein
VRHTRIIVTHYGGPDALRVVEGECPEPKDGEVRVKVWAAGVSLPDIMAREGVHPETPLVPFTPGWDLASRQRFGLVRFPRHRRRADPPRQPGFETVLCRCHSRDDRTHLGLRKGTPGRRILVGHQNITYSIPEVGSARFLIADWPESQSERCPLRAKRLNREHTSSHAREEFPLRRDHVTMVESAQSGKGLNPGSC